MNLHPLHQAIQNLERFLSRPIVQALGLGDIQALLRDLEQFHRQARQSTDAWQPNNRRNPDGPNQLAIAGHRISADLNEALISRLVDDLQAQDAAVRRLSDQLKQHLRQRDTVTRLLHQAQSIQRQSFEPDETSGLGLML